MKKVLLVEEGKRVSMALAIRLKSYGYEVLTASEGVARGGTTVDGSPDLILLDISMPADDGVSMAEKVQDLAGTVGTPIIFLTGSRRPGLRDTVLSMGAVDFFEEPYEAEELLDSVRRALGELPEEEEGSSNYALSDGHPIVE